MTHTQVQEKANQFAMSTRSFLQIIWTWFSGCRVVTVTQVMQLLWKKYMIKHWFFFYLYFTFRNFWGYVQSEGLNWCWDLRDHTKKTKAHCFFFLKEWVKRTTFLLINSCLVHFMGSQQFRAQVCSSMLSGGGACLPSRNTAGWGGDCRLMPPAETAADDLTTIFEYVVKMLKNIT